MYIYGNIFPSFIKNWKINKNFNKMNYMKVREGIG